MSNSTPPPGNREQPEESWPFAGLRISFRDLTDSYPVPPPDGHDAETCLLVMCLNGDMRFSLTGPEHAGDFSVPAGNFVLQYRPNHCQCTRCAEKHRAQLLELSCPARELRSLLDGTQLGAQLEEAMILGRPLHIHRPMSQAVVQSLLTLRETVRDTEGGTGPLVLSKVLETIWLFTQAESRDMTAHLSSETLRAVDRARSILESRMDDPPDLGALATQVGMSLSKLKQVFPQICGMPPYGYLRQVRMERAMHLLSREGRSVTEAALEVGYANLSHFSKTFAEHFGIKPSQAKRPAP